MQKILITGASGFVGSHLIEHLSSREDVAITGTYIINESLQTIPDIKEKAEWEKLNLLDSKATEELIQKVQPDIIYHLAALTSPKGSYDNPGETVTNNIQAEMNIFEALRKLGMLQTKVLITCSAEEYGLVDEKYLPINEQTPFNPTNPYAVSKIAQDFLGLQYFLAYRMPIIRVRPFNHIGPRQTTNFALPSFAKKIVDIEKGKMEPIMKVGNLDAKRDFTNVKDIVRAYTLLVDKGTLGDVYNVGSGKSYKMKDILDMMLSLSTAKITVEIDENFRPLDNPNLICDNAKLVQTTDWKPEISIDQTLKEILDYWRGIV